MKPPPFAYEAPRSLAAARDLLAEHGGDAKLLAGGQSLVPLLNFRLARPAMLVDLNRVVELDYVRQTADGALAIGAMTRQRRVERDRSAAAQAPLLAQALPWIAHPQIRNRGTFGGSLAHADPSAELPAVAVALEATVRMTSRRGDRSLPAGEFFTGLLATALEPDEILVEIELPPAPPRTGWCFLEVARRQGDYAQAGVAAGVTLGEDGYVAAARLVFLSAGDGPMIAHRAAAGLAGLEPTPGVFAAAAELAAAEEIDPADDIHASAAFKRHLAAALARRAMAQAAVRARARSSEEGAP